MPLRSASTQHRRRLLFRPYIYKVSAALGLLLSSLAIGIAGFRRIEGYDWLEAFYMTVITLGTVGFMEVRPLSDAGRVFTAFLILFNISIFAYSISTLTTLLMDNELRANLKFWRILKKIETLRDHVIVCGFGKHGHETVDELRKTRTPFVVLEMKEDRLEELRDDGKILFIDGDAADDGVLEEAGIRTAKALIVTFSDEAEAVYVVLSARQLNPKLRIIARALHEKASKKLEKAGADHVVSPERLGGFYMAALIKNPRVVEFFSLISNMTSGQPVLFEEFPCENFKREMLGQSLNELNIRTRTGANVIGLRLADGHYTVNPAPETRLKTGEQLVILGDESQMKRFRAMMFG